MMQTHAMNNRSISVPEPLVAKAIGWAKAMEQKVLANGSPISSEMQEVARAVGVMHPDKVRVLLVQEMPKPDDSDLRSLADATGMFAPDMTGLTVGYGILICAGHMTKQLLSHELRHVHQFEQQGSIADFLPVYLAQISQFGYFNAPLEIDARAHEVS